MPVWIACKDCGHRHRLADAEGPPQRYVVCHRCETVTEFRITPEASAALACLARQPVTLDHPIAL
jgi:phage FluMu protein Com